jgi:hypothetical protein
MDPCNGAGFNGSAENHHVFKITNPGGSTATYPPT